MSQRVYLIVIAVLVAIIFLQRSCTSNPSVGSRLSGKPEIKYDTVWKEVVKFQTKKIKILERDTTFLPGDSIFIPDAKYDKLKLQYELLAKNYGIRNIYRDSVQLDTLGFIVVTDTIQYNTVASRSYLHNYKLPTVIATVLPQPRRQLYIGGGISIDNGLNLSNLQVGLLYKNRKDQIYGLHTGISQNLQPYFGGSMYWKIKLKK